MLGDGHLEKHREGSRFYLHIGAKSQELVEHIHNLLADSGYCSPKKPMSKPAKPNKQSGKVYFTLNLKTYTFGSFDYYRNEWYSNGIKLIPASLEHDLTRKTLACWFMVDGNFTGYNFNIRTHSFTESKVEQQATLQCKKFNLKVGKCYRNKEKNWWKVIIYAKSLPLFDKLVVRPYILPRCCTSCLLCQNQQYYSFVYSFLLVVWFSTKYFFFAIQWFCSFVRST